MELHGWENLAALQPEHSGLTGVWWKHPHSSEHHGFLGS